MKKDEKLKSGFAKSLHDTRLSTKEDRKKKLKSL